jgi:hypothetical protein
MGIFKITSMKNIAARKAFMYVIRPVRKNKTKADRYNGYILNNLFIRKVFRSFIVLTEPYFEVSRNPDI